MIPVFLWMWMKSPSDLCVFGPEHKDPFIPLGADEEPVRPVFLAVSTEGPWAAGNLGGVEDISLCGSWQISYFLLHRNRSALKCWRHSKSGRAR